MYITVNQLRRIIREVLEPVKAHDDFRSLILSLDESDIAALVHALEDNRDQLTILARDPLILEILNGLAREIADWQEAELNEPEEYLYDDEKKEGYAWVNAVRDNPSMLWNGAKNGYRKQMASSLLRIYDQRT